MEIEKFRLLAHSLVAFFYPLLEASLFGSHGEVIEVMNPFSSLKEDQGSNLDLLKQEGSYLEILAMGRQVKRMVCPVLNATGDISGFLRLRYDTSSLHHLKDQLELLLGQPTQLKKEGCVNEWQVSVDQLVADYLKGQQITIEAATPKQKRELIALLDKKKLFNFKEASAYIAAKMQISRATIYNYLKTINSLQQVQIHQVDAFTDKKFGGNPAGVVLDAERLDETVMRKITRELNLSETSFILPSKRADFRLRYFTPTGHEISFFCHSTVGALYVIAQEKRYHVDQPGTYDFNVETMSGILKMEAVIDRDEKIRVAYEPPRTQLRPLKISYETVAKAASIQLEWINQEIPLMYDVTSKALFISMHSLDTLRQIQCDFKSLTSFAKDHECIVFCFLTKETFDPQNQLHMRCFAPLVGVHEDPFTGSILGGLTVYAHKFHILPSHATRFKVEQGHFIERPGFVEVEFSHRGDDYTIKIFAQAVHCFSTEINLT